MMLPYPHAEKLMDVLLDERLSFRAKGIMGFILSYGANCTIDDLIAYSKEGRQAVFTAVEELAKHGYIGYGIAVREL